MSKARDRADRKGVDPVNIGNARLSLDSAGTSDLKVTSQDGTTLKKVFAEQIQLGTGSNRVIIKKATASNAFEFQTTDGSTTEAASIGTSTVTNASDLPLSGNNAGDTIFVTSNNNLMIFNGSGWYKIATVTNASPTISSAGNATYSFATDGTPIIVEITATDPEGLALQYKYQVTSGSIGSTATVTSSSTSGGTYSAINANTLTSNKYFKVTPSTNTAHAGTFSLTFSASDGVNVANSSASAFTLVFETYGSAFFDGVDDSLDLPASSDFALGTGDFTIECWVKFSDTSLDSGGGNSNRRIFSLNASAGNQVDKLQICIDDGSYRTNGDLFLYSNSDQGYLGVDIRDEWHHIAVVRNSGTLKFYLDGVEKDSNSNTQDYSPNSGSPAPIIGQRGDNRGDYHGYISNFRMVVGTAVYTSNFTTPTAPLTAITNTKLLTAHKNNEIVDGSSSNHTITKSGDVTHHASNPFSNNTIGYGSLYFDGTGDSLAVGGGTSFSFATGAFTVECWYQPKFDTAGSSTIMLWDLGDNHVRVRFKNGQIRAQLGSETQILYNISGSSLDQATWYHSALTRDGSGNVKLFHNGSEVGSYTGSTYNVASTTLKIADINLALSGYEFTGYISNFRLVKGTAVYTSGFTPSTTPLTAITNTKLLTAQRREPLAVTNGSTVFDGSGDYIDTTNPLSGTGDFTMEGWIYHTTSGTYDGYFATCQASGANGGIVVAKDKFFVTHGGGSSQIGFSTIENNAWYHIALQRSSNVFSLYLNGVLQGTASATVSLTGSTLRLGSRYMDNTTYLLTGYISNFRIVTASTVYVSSGFTTPNSALTAVSGTQLLTCQNSTGSITDASSNNYTITANGNVAASTVTPTKVATDQSTSNHTTTANGQTRNAVNWPFNYNG